MKNSEKLHNGLILTNVLVIIALLGLRFAPTDFNIAIQDKLSSILKPPQAQALASTYRTATQPSLQLAKAAAPPAPISVPVVATVESKVDPMQEYAKKIGLGDLIVQGPDWGIYQKGVVKMCATGPTLVPVVRSLYEGNYQNDHRFNSIYIRTGFSADALAGTIDLMTMFKEIGKAVVTHDGKLPAGLSAQEIGAQLAGRNLNLDANKLKEVSGIRFVVTEKMVYVILYPLVGSPKSPEIVTYRIGEIIQAIYNASDAQNFDPTKPGTWVKAVSPTPYPVVYTPPTTSAYTPQQPGYNPPNPVGSSPSTSGSSSSSPMETSTYPERKLTSEEKSNLIIQVFEEQGIFKRNPKLISEITSLVEYLDNNPSPVLGKFGTEKDIKTIRQHLEFIKIFMQSPDNVKFSGTDQQDAIKKKALKAVLYAINILGLPQKSEITTALIAIMKELGTPIGPETADQISDYLRSNNQVIAKCLGAYNNPAIRTLIQEAIRQIYK